MSMKMLPPLSLENTVLMPTKNLGIKPTKYLLYFFWA